MAAIRKGTILLLSVCLLFLVLVPSFVVWLKSIADRVQPPLAPLVIRDINNPVFTQLQPIGSIRSIDTRLSGVKQLIVLDRGRAVVVKGESALSIVVETNLVPQVIASAGRVSKVSDEEFLYFSVDGACLLGRVSSNVFNLTVLTLRSDGFKTDTAVGWRAGAQTRVAAFLNTVDQGQRLGVFNTDVDGTPSVQETVFTNDVTRLASGGAQLSPIVVVDFSRNELVVITDSGTRSSVDRLGPPSGSIGFLTHVQLFNNSTIVFAAYSGGFATFSTLSMSLLDLCFLPFFAEVTFADISENSGSFVATTNVGLVVLGQVARLGTFKKNRMSFLRLLDSLGPCAVSDITEPQQIVSFFTVNARGLVNATRVVLPELQS